MFKTVRKLLALNIAVILLWLGAFAITNHSCPKGSCGEAGLVFVPLFIVPFIATTGIILVDITLIVKHFVPIKYKPTINWLVPSLIVGSVLLWFALVALTSFHKNNYTTQKAVESIKSCQAYSLGGYGPQPYIYLKQAPAKGILVSGGDAARLALNEAAQNSATTCGYDTKAFLVPVN